MLILQLSTFGRREEGGQDRGECVGQYGWVGTKQGWSSPPNRFGPSSSFTARLPQPGIAPPRVSQSFPATRLPPQDKETEVGGRQRQIGVALTTGGLRVCSGSRSLLAFGGLFLPPPPAAPDLLLLLLLPLCSRRAGCHNKASLRSPHQKLLPSHNMSSNRSARAAWAPIRKRLALAKRETSAQDGRVFSTGF